MTVGQILGRGENGNDPGCGECFAGVIARIRACACGERMNAACAAPELRTSSVYTRRR